MNCETYHVPVLLNESIDGLDIKSNGIYVDVTFGGGGHSKEILRRLKAQKAEKGKKNSQGHLYSFDQDADAEKNIVDDSDFTFVRSNFRYLKNFMKYHGVEQIDGLLADLGVSSHHFDEKDRGFSFRFDGKLDMRMNQRSGLTAADVVNKYSEKQLADILYFYGELKNSRQLAAKIVKARNEKPIETTQQLAELISSQQQPMAFQAIRIEVNHEMDALKEMLKSATEILKPGGRLVIITYHSLEDRLVKNIMKSGNVEGEQEKDFFGKVNSPFTLINKKVIVPSDEELERNPRSRSAKLRIAEKN